MAAGGESFAHRNFSYKARGHYAEQLPRWFAEVDRERFLIVESEDLFLDAAGPGTGPVVAGGRAPDVAFPSSNDAPRARPEEASVVDGLRRHFTPYNEDAVRPVGRAAVGPAEPRRRPARPPPTWPRPAPACPVQRSRAKAAWWTSMPRPPTVAAPAPAASANRGVTRGW